MVDMTQELLILGMARFLIGIHTNEKRGIGKYPGLITLKFGHLR